jgi:ankyrin repeat protein
MLFNNLIHCAFIKIKIERVVMHGQPLLDTQAEQLLNELNPSPILERSEDVDRMQGVIATGDPKDALFSKEDLFSLVANRNIIALNTLAIRIDDLAREDDKNTLLLQHLVDTRDQRMMNFFFDTVVMPYFEKQGEINFNNDFALKTIIKNGLIYQQGLSLLDFAILFNQVEFIHEHSETIVKKNLLSKSGLGLPLLFSAAIKADYLEVIDFLIEQGAALNPPLTERTPETALALAASAGSVNAIDLLVHRGAKGIDFFSDRYHSPIQLAMLKGHYPVFISLLNYGARTFSSWFPLAIQGGNVQIIDKMIERHNININDWTDHPSGVSALELTITAGSIDVFDLLIARGLNIANINPNGDTGLHLAVLYRRIPIIRRILEMNILDINLANNVTGEIPLHLTFHEDAEKDNAPSDAIVALFAEYHANLDAVSGEKEKEEGELFEGQKTALHCAIEAQDVEGVHALLQHKANPNIPNAKKQTPLDLALKIQNKAITSALLEAKARLFAMPTPKRMEESFVALLFSALNAQKRSLETGVDSPSKRMKPTSPN